MYIDKAYDKLSPFPKDNIAPESKGAKWTQQMAVALYTSYLNNRCANTFTDLETLRENRLYGAGKQDWRQYMKMLVTEKEAATENYVTEGWMNVNFKDIITVIPKFKNILKGILTSTPTSIGCYGYNEAAGSLREEMEYALKTKVMFRETIQLVKAFIQDQEDTEYIPASMRELDMFAKLGGLKLKEETAMEILIKKTEDMSQWEDIFENLIDDAFDLGMIAARDYTDISTGVVKYKYIDPLSSAFILDEVGEVIKGFTIRLMTIADIRANKVYGTKEQDEDKVLSGDEFERKLSRLARRYSSNFGNKTFDDYNPDPEKNPYGYDEFLIPVLEFEVISVDTRFTTTRKTASGDEITYPEHWKRVKNSNGAFKYSMPTIHDTDDKKTTQSGVRVVRKGCWVIGEDMTFDFGLQLNMPRPTKKEVKNSFIFRIIKGEAMARLCKRPADDIQLANLKIQNSLAMAPNSGIIYDWASLKSVNIKKGDRNLEPYDLIRMHRQTGSTIINTKNARGIPTSTGQPLMELTGGIGPLLEECITIIQKSVGDIQSQIGFNEFTDGSTPAERSGVGIGQMASAGTSNALKPIHTKLTSLRIALAVNASCRIQVICKYNQGGVEAYAQIIGEPLIESLKIGSSFVSILNTIRIIEEASPQEIQEMEMTLQQAMASGKNGVPLIKMSDYFAIKRILKSKASLKFAQLLMAEREREAEAAAAETASRNAKENAENAIAVEQNKAKQEAAVEQQKHENEKKIISHEADEEIRKYTELKKLGIKNVPGVADVTSNLSEAPIETDALGGQLGAQPASVQQVA